MKNWTIPSRRRLSHLECWAFAQHKLRSVQRREDFAGSDACQRWVGGPPTLAARERAMRLPLPYRRPSCVAPPLTREEIVEALDACEWGEIFPRPPADL